MTLNFITFKFNTKKYRKSIAKKNKCSIIKSVCKIIYIKEFNMKKIINVKEIMIILLSITLIAIATNVFAIDAVLGDGATQISGNEYDNAQNVPSINQNNTANNTTNNSTNNTTNNAVNNSSNNSVKTYNNSNNTSNLPQTGIEDYNVGILLVICIASAIYAYKKVSYYKNV